MLSKTGINAIKALAVLGGLAENEYIGATAVATQIGAPKNYLGKLLQTLSREGLVVSQKGLGGGFRLAMPASEISLFMVASPVEQLQKWEGCFFSDKMCDSKNPCIAHSEWGKVRDSFMDFLNHTSIEDVMSKKSDFIAK
jgi:Rrf2 family protein